MGANVATVDDLQAMESRLSKKIEELKDSNEPKAVWVKNSVVQKKYGFCTNKIKAMVKKRELKAKKTGGLWLYDVAAFDRNENSSD